MFSDSILDNMLFQKCEQVGEDYDGGYMGCPNMSISFNNDSQKYQWEYLHTSITDNNQNELTTILKDKYTLSYSDYEKQKIAEQYKSKF